MIRVLFFACAVMALLAGSPAHGQATVDLSERSEAALDAGERVRVIVRFRFEETAFDGLETAEADLQRRATIEELGDGILIRNFGQDAQSLADNEVAGPQLNRRFAYTPAIAITVSRAELDALAADDAVEHIETDALDRPFLDVSVPLIGANVMHASGATGEGTTIAILDTGIHYSHPAFGNRILDSACFSSNDVSINARSICANQQPSDVVSLQAAQACTGTTFPEECLHGTHVASIASGAPAGSYSYAGVAPESLIIPVQVFSLVNSEQYCTPALVCVLSRVSDQIAALEWLYTNRASTGLTAVNMSLGGAPVIGPCNDDARAPIISQLLQAGIPTTVATGNDRQRDAVSAPACIENSVAVAASRSDRAAPYVVANRGELSDFYAPGETIRAAGTPSGANIDLELSGTSMAAPHMAGAIALLRSTFPAATLDQILDAFAATGEPAPVGGSGSSATRPVIRVDQAAELLSQTLGEPGALSLTPDEDRLSRGEMEIANSFESLTYTLTNTGGATVPWSIVSESAILRFETRLISASASASAPVYTTDTSGNLAPGAMIEIRVTPNAFLPEGERVETFFVNGGGFPIRRDIAIETLYPAPVNDNIEDAIAIRGTSFNFTNRVGNATFQPNEPTLENSIGSVWFAWTPDRTIPIHLSLPPNTRIYATSDLGAMQGNALGSYGQTIFATLVELDIVAGQTYYIQVGVRAGLSDFIQLRVSFPGQQIGGDEVFRPYRLTASSGRSIDLPFLPQQGGMTANEPQIDGHVGGRRWFVWTASYTGQLSIQDAELYGSDRHSSFAVYRRTDGADVHLETDSPDLLERIGFVQMSQNEPVDEAEAATRVLTVNVVEGTTYWIRVGNGNIAQFTWGLPHVPQHEIRTAVLPNHRNSQYGNRITAFMTAINPPRFGTDARNCRPLIYNLNPSQMAFAGEFHFQRTDAQNRPVGEADAPFNIPSGGTQSMVFWIEGGPEGGPRVDLDFICDNFVPPRRAVGADGFTYWLSAIEMPDVIMVAVTPSGDGIINATNQGTVAFSVAAINIGSDNRTLRFDSPGFRIDSRNRFDTEVCQTNPTTGQCLAARAQYVDLQIPRGETRTFTVFMTSRFDTNHYDPVLLRLSPKFSVSDESGEFDTTPPPGGITSVAIRATLN